MDRQLSSKLETNHIFDNGSMDRSFSKSIKKIYSIFNVHESPETARRLGEDEQKDVQISNELCLIN